jgi:CheY-like chemotaxis protein
MKFRDAMIDLDMAPDLSCIRGDWSLIERALGALVENAAEAVEESGRIRICADELTVVSSHHSVRGYPEPGRYVRLQVTDDGPGMDKDALAKALLPFFSTKDKGRGSGMGLPVAYGLVGSQGGYLTVESEPQEGTTASVYLPVMPVVQSIEIAEDTPAGDEETILIVDDETSVTGTVSEMLRELGYSVYVANSGEEALRIYSDKKGAIDLVILDMMMPKMSGKETFESLKEIDPGLRVLLTTGFDHQEPDAKKICEENPAAFVAKPFKAETLSEAVKETMERKEP